jgi:putative DNA primase/helicase
MNVIDFNTKRHVNLDGYPLTEDGIALAFTAIHKNDLRYDHDRGRWYAWTGTIWREERTRLAFDWVRTTCRDIGERQDGADEKILQFLGRASTASAVEKFAQADRAFAVRSDIWDCDPYLLGTPGGVVDLRTGQMLPPRRDHYITKSTAVAPSKSANCPLWLKFVGEVTKGDAGLVNFLQDYSGYTLTGDTREHALFFGYGPGGNGKGVLMNTLSKLMGDYCRIVPMETFTASNSDRHPTDIAMLHGARMACAVETEEGRAWAETKIKTLTGGDKVSARFMRQDFFEFTPQFKLMLIGNHKPILRDVGESTRRRFNMVELNHQPLVKDLELESKLKTEWPEILRWMIDGCLNWQRNGLQRPEVVRNATEQYFTEQDVIKRWIEDECEKDKNLADTFPRLFGSWKEHAEINGDQVGTSRWFSKQLERLGYTKIKDVCGIRGRGFQGIRLRD